MKREIITTISRIRDEIGHDNIQPDIKEVIFNEEKKEILIITTDRPEKSLVIGKGGWVVGRLKEELKVNQIHVEAYSDIVLRKYRMKLALAKLGELKIQYNFKPLNNLYNLLKRRIRYPYSLDEVLDDLNSEPNSNKSRAILALSGGVDSSFALIIAHMMGFHLLAVTVNPGDIILPKYFRKNVEELCKKLGVQHHYVGVDMSEVVEGALQGRYHPCGRCSTVIEEKVLEHTRETNSSLVIFGDLLATGAQSLVDRGDILRINLPAMLSVTKGETKALAGNYGVYTVGGYGCPLLAEVKKKYSYMNRFSVQRILRETRAGVLEPGEALDMVMSLCRSQ
jgi:uncharacterized protein